MLFFRLILKNKSVFFLQIPRKHLEVTSEGHHSGVDLELLANFTLEGFKCCSLFLPPKFVGYFLENII